jgi:signal transduction histidine kinase
LTWAIQNRLPKRQAVLFLLVLAAPCLVLTGLGLQVNRQERQLAAQRAAEDRQRSLAQFRADLLSALERVKHQAATGRAGAPVDLVATVHDGSLVLPFDDDPQAGQFRHALQATAFGARIRQAEQEELSARNFDHALEQYRAAIAESRTPGEHAYATLLLGRAEQKAGRHAEALAHYSRVVHSPAEAEDEYGIPIALYAAGPLLESGGNAGEVALALRAMVPGLPRMSPPALSMLRDLAEKAGTPELLPELNRQLRRREQAEALQTDFPGVLARLQAEDPVWIPYGNPAWLLALDPRVGPDPALVAVGVDGLPALLGRSAEGVQLLLGKQGDSLGDSFPGLRAILHVRVPQDASPGRTLLALALAFVVGLTLIAGFFLWRDVRRDARLAELRSQFISGVSHELRTPLTSIRMFTESMRLDDEMDADTRAEYLDTVLRETERLSRLVDNVLHFSRIEQGRASYDLQPASLAEIVDKAVRAFSRPAEQAGFRLDVSMAPDLPPVLADNDALQQAILNLLGNAMKYSGTSREIALRVEAELENSSAAIRVVDRGIGIAPGEQARIFQRFYRAATAENLRIPGTGLGLTLVEHIARAHGGDVSVESHLAGGSTFAIRIPFALDHSLARAAIPERT